MTEHQEQGVEPVEVALARQAQQAAESCWQALQSCEAAQRLLGETLQRHPTMHRFNALERVIKEMRGRLPKTIEHTWRQASDGWWTIAMRHERKACAMARYMRGLGVPQDELLQDCLLYTSPSPRDFVRSRMASSA